MTAATIASHKKCLVCGYKTVDFRESTCKCGGYLYTVSQYYEPKVSQRHVSDSDTSGALR